MKKKPLTMQVKDANEASRKLNALVEKGAYSFDFGITDEYVVTVTKRSDGSTSQEKEKHFRFTGFYETYVGEELDELNAVREDMKNVKKEREEMNRTLDVMNKPAFAPISIFLLCVGLFCSIFGILTLAKVLPLPEGQLPISIVLTIVGVLAIAGSIVLCIFRNKKKGALLLKKDEILKQDEDLKAKEKDVDNRTPSWYKDALWTSEGNKLKNASQTHELRK